MIVSATGSRHSTGASRRRGKDGGQRLLWHGGGSFGMTSQMVLYPDTEDGYVLLANDACAGSEGELKAIGMKLHGALNARSPRP
jgi:hypothetical protein